MTTATDNITTVRRVLEAFAGSGDPQPMYDAAAEDVVFELLVPRELAIPRVYRGRDGMRDFYAQAEALMELVEFEVHDYLGNDRRVVVVGHERYRVRSTGKEYATSWVLHFEFTDGRVVRMQSFEDLNGLVEPAP